MGWWENYPEYAVHTPIISPAAGANNSRNYLVDGRFKCTVKCSKFLGYEPTTGGAPPCKDLGIDFWSYHPSLPRVRSFHRVIPAARVPQFSP